MRYSVPTKWQSDIISSKQHQSEMEEVHTVRFAKLCEVIDKEIIISKKVMKMTDLCSLYYSIHICQKHHLQTLITGQRRSNQYQIATRSTTTNSVLLALVKSRDNISQILFLVTKLTFQKLLSMGIYWDVQIRFRM